MPAAATAVPGFLNPCMQDYLAASTAGWFSNPIHGHPNVQPRSRQGTRVRVQQTRNDPTRHDDLADLAWCTTLLIAIPIAGWLIVQLLG